MRPLQGGVGLAPGADLTNATDNFRSVPALLKVIQPVRASRRRDRVTNLEGSAGAWVREPTPDAPRWGRLHGVIGFAVEDEYGLLVSASVPVVVEVASAPTRTLGGETPWVTDTGEPTPAVRCRSPGQPGFGIGLAVLVLLLIGWIGRGRLE